MFRKLPVLTFISFVAIPKPWHDMFDVERGPLECLVHATVFAPLCGTLGGLDAEFRPTRRSLWTAPQQVERFGARQRKRLTKFDQEFQVHHFIGGKLAFGVAVHQLLQAMVCLRGQSKVAYELNPIKGCGNDGHRPCLSGGHLGFDLDSPIIASVAPLSTESDKGSEQVWHENGGWPALAGTSRRPWVHGAEPDKRVRLESLTYQDPLSHPDMVGPVKARVWIFLWGGCITWVLFLEERRSPGRER